MGRPTMDEMREREKAAREGKEPKLWNVDIFTSVQYMHRLQVRASTEAEAKAEAHEEADILAWEDYDEADLLVCDVQVAPPPLPEGGGDE